MSKSSDAYIAWNISSNTLTTISYTAVFAPDAFLGLSDLQLYGSNVDVLDRQKTGASALGGLVTLDEEDLALISQSELTIGVFGPVRGVGNDDDFSVAGYVNRFESVINLKTNELGFSPDTIFSVFDLNNPAATGLTSYFDSNTTTATIDGSPDTVNATPAIDWYQASGSSGGFVVTYPDKTSDQGTIQNYYQDDDAVDSSDTGDQKSYGASGMQFDSPGSYVDVTAVLFMLPENTSQNMGTQYFQQVQNPLTASATLQSYHTNKIYLPFINK
jgi:hypothetical protein